jgi:hypothetical protein
MLPPILPAPSFLPAAPSCLFLLPHFWGYYSRLGTCPLSPDFSRPVHPGLPIPQGLSCLPGLSYSLVMASAMASSLLPTSISSDLFTLLKIHLATS